MLRVYPCNVRSQRVTGHVGELALPLTPARHGECHQLIGGDPLGHLQRWTGGNPAIRRRDAKTWELVA